MGTTLREKILRELEQERIQSEIRKNNAEAKRLEIDHERIQSEIRRNDAEAKKMKAEENHFKKSKDILSQYIFPGLVGGLIITVTFLDTFKNIYDMTSHQIKDNKEIQKKIFNENEKLKNDKKKLEKDQTLLSHENEGLKLEKDSLQKERIKFAARIRVVEKRYLEALIRQAYSNAYNAYVQLVKRQEIYLPQGAASQRKAEKAYLQACQSLHDYWKLVVKITEENQKDLFLEVKQEIADQMKEGKKVDSCSESGGTDDERPQLFSPIQRNSLELIENHIAQVRTGNSQFPDDLIETLMKELESQQPR